MTLQLRHAVLAVALVTMLPACTRAPGPEAPPARQSPIAVPSAPSSPATESEDAAPPELIPPENAEQLGMTATSTMTVAGPTGTNTLTLTQSTVTESAIEQNEGETERVVRLTTADPKQADDVQFSVDGRATAGTFTTKAGQLTVVFYNAALDVNLLSDAGECTVVFDRVDVRGAAGSVRCEDIAVPTGKAQLAATFSAVATDAQ